MSEECAGLPHVVNIFCAEVRYGRRADVLHGKPMRHRIHELRTTRGWSMRELADRAHTSPSTINSLEKGYTKLTLPWIERMAKVFGVSPSEILGIEREIGPGFQEDAVLFEQRHPGFGNLSLTDTQFLYLVKTNALDQLGILPGHILVVDMAPAIMEKIATGDVVIAQLYKDTTAVTALRQFVEPSLLITNSLSENAPSTNLRADDAAIKGAVVSSHRQFGRRATE